MKTRQSRSLPTTARRRGLRTAGTAAVAVVALGLTAACGADPAEEAESPAGTTESSAPSPTETDTAAASPSEPTEPTEPSEPAGTVVAIEIAGGDVSPKGERVQVSAGEPVTLEITSDVAGELHVHATPEQEIAFEAGTSTHQLTLEQPGVVDVELHEPDVTVVQLEVR